MISFDLQLFDSYWSKGFFNVGVDFQRYLAQDAGPIDIYLQDETQPISGRITRSANRNVTPRISGNKPLADWFQDNCKRGGLVKIEIISPTAIRIRTVATVPPRPSA